MVQRTFYRRAFTLIELLVVIAIISVLIAMLMPALTAARRSAQSVTCMSNLRQMGISTHNYADDHRGEIPEFFFNFTAGNSNNIIVLIVPKHVAVAGFDYYLDDITLCPSDTDPDPVQVVTPNNTMQLQPVSYGVNADMVIRDINRDELIQPSELALFFDGTMSGPVDDPNYLQGRYSGSMELVQKLIEKRHENRFANSLFMDTHVEPITEITPDMIAKDGKPYEGPGNGNTGGGGNNGGNAGGGNSGGGGNGKNK